MIFFESLNRSLLSRIIVRIVLVLAVLFFAFPLYWMICTAFKDRITFLSYPPVFFFKPTLDNFIDVFESQDFIRAFVNSVIVGTSTVLASVLLGVPCAYGLSRFKIKGKDGISFWILSTKFAPAVIVLVPFFIIYSKLHLTDTYVGLILIYMILNIPLVVWIMNGFLRDVPISIEEAACLDGASRFTTFRKIVLPLVRPGIVATMILCLVFTWNDLLFGLILSSTNCQLLPVAIYNNISYEEIAWGKLCASGLIAVIPVSIFTLIIQKHLVTGLTFGAVKE